MRKLYRRHHRWLRHLPRRRHLKGGRLHRLLGEGLFAQELWRPTRHGTASGLALGLFIGLTPTMGVQVLLAGIAAYLLRVNIPIALAATFVSNPFTVAFLYSFEYRIGVWIVGVPEPHELEGYTGMLRNFARHAKPLWIGSIVVSGTVAALVYGLVMLLWQQIRRFAHADAGGIRKK